MLESFKVTFLQILVLFAFIGIGYILKKSGKVSGDFNKGLSNLIVCIFLPFLNFGSIAENFKLNILADKAGLLLASALLLIFFMMLAFVMSRILTKNRDTRDVYMYSFTFQNSGYFGNPFVLAMFGELVLFDYMIFCIPFFLLTYTFGIYILNPNRKLDLKNLLNPPMVALVLGMISGVLDIKLPGVVNTIIDTGANCMAPAAMILTGIVFASNDLKKMISNVRVYIACFIKMAVIPVIAVFILAALRVPYDIGVMIAITMTLPAGLNSVIFPEANGGDSCTGAQLCFVSTFTCLIVLPFVYSLYTFLCG